MLRNYMLAALRNLRRSKVLALINILGLAIGISASLVIFLVIQNAYSFDHFEPQGNNIYRIVGDYSEQGSQGNTRGVQGPLINAVQHEVTGVNLLVPFRYFNPDRQAIEGPGMSKSVKFPTQDNIIFADSAYFILVGQQWLAGSPNTALSSPGSVVLSESRAKLYFPNKPYDQLMGAKIIYNDSIVAQVTGIVADLNKQGNTDFTFQEFISLATMLDNQFIRKNMFWDQWGSTTSDQQCYVRLNEGTKPASVTTQLKAINKKYKGDDETKNHYSWTYVLQPLNDVHFNNKYGTFKTQIADKNVLLCLSLVAVFLLALASINFINLTTAQGVARAKEIGIRKTLGSSRKQLIGQFLSETFVITLVAGLISLFLLPYLVKAFSSFIPEGLTVSLRDPKILGFLLILTIIVSFFSGLYPALVLSSVKTAGILSNQGHGGTSKTRASQLRQVLTVFQFVIAQFFIMGIFLVAKQINFMMSKDLGFKKEAIVSFDLPNNDTTISHRLALQQEVGRIPGVMTTTLGSDVPNSGGWWTTDLTYKDGKKELPINAEVKVGDDNYLSMFHISIIAGRNLVHTYTLRELLINEKMVHILGFKTPDEAIGKSFPMGTFDAPIVGVIKDFYAHSLDNKLNPMIFFHSISDGHKLMIALDPTNKNAWTPAIHQMEHQFKSMYPDADFSYKFLDEDIANSYNYYLHIRSLLGWATGLTIFISCLGLLGLVTYTTHQRTKEIGVRKVLGASITSIVKLLSKDFITLVAIAFVIATPLAWWAIHAWLQNFAFHMEVSWWAFPLCGIILILISFVTLSFQTIRAASVNPVKSLRSE
jgi:putative ABC transport system permease protein